MYGLVIYAGHDSKLMMNSGKRLTVPSKPCLLIAMKDFVRNALKYHSPFRKFYEGPFLSLLHLTLGCASKFIIKKIPECVFGALICCSGSFFTQ